MWARSKKVQHGRLFHPWELWLVVVVVVVVATVPCRRRRGWFVCASVVRRRSDLLDVLRSGFVGTFATVRTRWVFVWCAVLGRRRKLFDWQRVYRARGSLWVFIGGEENPPSQGKSVTEYRKIVFDEDELVMMGAKRQHHRENATRHRDSGVYTNFQFSYVWIVDHAVK